MTESWANSAAANVPRMSPSYRILITCIDAFGHINFTLAFGDLLKERGHEVIFANRKQYESLATERGFKFIPFDEQFFKDSASQPFVQWVGKNFHKFRQDTLERFNGWSEEDKQAFATMFDTNPFTDAAVAKVLESAKPDVVIGDFVQRYPCFYHCKVPYIPLISFNPLVLYPEGPPVFSGLSVHVDKDTDLEFRKQFDDATSPLASKHNAWLTERKVPIPNTPWVLDEPEYFGIYHFPAALDYDECGPRLSNWIRVDVAIRQPTEEKFVLPEVLAKRSGKLIYLSMGSLGSADVELMRRLIGILGKSPHRFIVSKGPRGDEIDLPDNMWGENYINQIKVLQIVDMVITHGGNNTIMETLYYAKPLIVIPFFFDQLDNAQRVVDKNIGRRLDFCSLDEKRFLDAVEETLADEVASRRIKEISDSMKNTDSRQKAVETVEKLIERTKNV